MNLFQSLMYLGGRPMTAGHNDDIEEPFPRAYGNRVASLRPLQRRRQRGHAEVRRAPPASPRTCATC